MKRLLMRSKMLLVLALSGAATRSSAQAAPEKAAPFRRANVVRLYTAAAPADVLHALAYNLCQRGFALDSVAYEAGVVTTQPTIPPGTESWPLVVRLTRFAGGVELTGTFTTGLAGPAGVARYPAEFWGFDWSPAKKTFRELETTARSFGGEVRFSRRRVATWGTVK